MWECLSQTLCETDGQVDLEVGDTRLVCPEAPMLLSLSAKIRLSGMLLVEGGCGDRWKNS